MKITKLFTALTMGICLCIPTYVCSQPEAIEANCKSVFEYPFVMTSKPFRALLTGDEVAEFKATLFSNTTYRIAVGSKENNQIIFSVYDSNRNLLFTNKDYDNARYWDFDIDGYMDCIIEARLDPELAQSGFAIVMTGIKVNQ